MCIFALCHYSLDEYVGRHYSDFAPDEQKDLKSEMVKAIHCGKEIKEVPVCFYRKNGGIVPLLLDTNVSYSEDGSLHHTRYFFRDDTGRRRGAFFALVYSTLQSKTLKTSKNRMSCSSLVAGYLHFYLVIRNVHVQFWETLINRP